MVALLSRSARRPVGKRGRRVPRRVRASPGGDHGRRYLPLPVPASPFRLSSNMLKKKRDRSRPTDPEAGGAGGRVVLMVLSSRAHLDTSQKVLRAAFSERAGRCAPQTRVGGFTMHRCPRSARSTCICRPTFALAAPARSEWHVQRPLAPPRVFLERAGRCAPQTRVGGFTMHRCRRSARSTCICRPTFAPAAPARPEWHAPHVRAT